jgi:hypothetical protein
MIIKNDSRYYTNNYYHNHNEYCNDIIKISRHIRICLSAVYLIKNRMFKIR